VDRIAVETDVLVPPAAVFDVLVDFPAYAQYSEYLERVEPSGDGREGTTYDLTVAWWRLRHTVRSRVTDTVPPERIDWRLLGPIAAAGAWVIEEITDPVVPAPAAAGAGDASRVRLELRYDAATVEASTLDLPLFLSLDGLVDRLAPVLEDEAEQIVERIVADLEGERRPVSLRVEAGD